MLQVPERFSKNQLDYLLSCQISWLNIAEGGKRAGKNILNNFAFCQALETHKNKLHLIAGVTQGTARLNVLDCDGFGIYNYFNGRYKKGKYENKEAVFIKTKTGTKILIVVGGGKKGDYKLIKGNTYGMAYLTEANELDQDFISEVFDRTLSSSNRKIFMDLNPKAPNHWYYKMLEFHEQKQQENCAYGYNYGHFTLVDNMSLSDEKIKQVLDTYDKRSIYYKRDIKGLRIACEGLCHPYIAEHIEEMMIDESDERLKNIVIVRVGVDFGGSLSKHSFVCTGITRNYREAIFLESERIDPVGMTPTQLEERYCAFVERNINKWKKPITSRCDSAEQTLINGFRIASSRKQLQNVVRNAIKSSINGRITLFDKLAEQGRLLFLKGYTQSIIEAETTCVWDSKAAEQGEDVRLDNNTTDIDTCDAGEYTIEEDSKNFLMTK